MLAIVTDSTSDLTPADLKSLDVHRVPLYVAFQGKTHKDWVEISPKDIIAGVQAGADLPSTSQPSPGRRKTHTRLPGTRTRRTSPCPG